MFYSPVVNLNSESQVYLIGVGGLFMLVAASFLTMCMTYILNIAMKKRKNKKIIKKGVKELNDDRIFRFVEEARRDFENDSSGD